MLEKYQINIWVYGYSPGDKVQILVESTGQICPVVLIFFWTLSPGFGNNHTFKYWSRIFWTILSYIIMLENCQSNISVYGSSPIQGPTIYSCWNLMKLGSQSGTYKEIDIYLFMILKWPFSPVKWGTFQPGNISVFVWPPNTFI